MRPVNRGNSTVGTNAGYTPPTNLTFTGGNAALMNKIFNTSSPTLSNCLKLWLHKVKNLPPHNTNYTQNDMDQAVKKIQGRVNDIYKKASVPLTQRLGNFCSYCEIPLSGLLEVEHVIPKSQYPTFSTVWENFLLACSACNTKKSDDPTRQYVISNWGVPATAPESAFANQIRNNHFIWPDINPNSWVDFESVLYYLNTSNNKWEPINIQYSGDIRNRLISYDISKREVIADVVDKNGIPQRISVRVALQVKNTTDKTKAQQMIKLCGLNDDGSFGSTYDRRVLNRTLAWFNILRLVEVLEAVDSGDPNKVTEDQQKFDTLWPIVLINAAAIGFYSLWVEILGTYASPDGTSLARRFVNNTNTANLYPNTNITNLPH